MNKILHPILVTGSHRSGSTWVGKMLAADSGTRYINEPLNLNHRPGIFRAHVPHWYQYVCEDNQDQYLDALQETLGFNYHLRTELRSVHSPRDIARLGRDFATFGCARVRRQRALLKDPFAVFSVPWFARTLKCRVVVLIRHPAAFAASLSRLGWVFDFDDLLNQPLLMRDHLERYRAEMLAVNRTDIVGQAALLWRMIYNSVHAFQESVPGLIAVRHEDLSHDPIDGYRRLYSELHLKFSPDVVNFIARSSSSDNPKMSARGQANSVRLDSAANVSHWKRKLSEQDILRIRTVTGEVAQRYYSNDEWQDPQETLSRAVGG